ncbi:MAG TPA: hypothetical protein VND80_10135 [Steroidobacteraceae bacterium]|nr:hypothetical protein [Steroidobacteraceae bacterium]
MSARAVRVHGAEDIGRTEREIPPAATLADSLRVALLESLERRSGGRPADWR